MADDAQTPPVENPPPTAPPRDWLPLFRATLPPPPKATPPRAAAELRRREEFLARWVDELKPRDEVERDLARRAGHLAWALQQAQEAEAALVARRGDDAVERRAERAEILGRRLLGEAPIPPRLAKAGLGLPGVLLRRLEATAEGCHWLIARWDEQAAALQANRPVEHEDVLRWLRLMGKSAIDVIYDAEANAMLADCERSMPGYAAEFLEAQAGGRRWRLLARTPPRWKGDYSPTMLERIARRTERLKRRLRVLEANAVAEPAAPDRGLERLARLQAARSRELRQVLTLYHKLRGASEAPQNARPADRTAPKEAKAETRPPRARTPAAPAREPAPLPPERRRRRRDQPAHRGPAREPLFPRRKPTKPRRQGVPEPVS